MLMVFCGSDEAELKRRAGYAYRNWVPGLESQPFARMIEALSEMFSPLLASIGAAFCPIAGMPEQVVEKMQEYAEAGVEELIIQWMDTDDIEGLHTYAEYILPHMAIY